MTDEDLEKLIESKDSNNTKQVVKTSVRLLEEYLSVKDNFGVKTVTKMDTASVQVMTLTLRKFYAVLKKVDGSHFAKASLVTLRYGLQKHFLKTRKENIINSNMYKRRQRDVQSCACKHEKGRHWGNKTEGTC